MSYHCQFIWCQSDWCQSKARASTKSCAKANTVVTYGLEDMHCAAVSLCVCVRA